MISLRAFFRFFSVLSQILYIAYLSYTVICNIGIIYVNAVLLTLSAIYFIVDVIITIKSRKQKQKAKTKTNEENDKVDKIKKVISSYFQLSESDLLSASRKPQIVYARNLCYYLIREELGYNYSKIGEIFGGKDHTSVMYGVDKVSSSKENDTLKDIQYLKEKLNQ